MTDLLKASAVSTMRAMILCACGALLGLGIAGYGLFTASGTSTRHVPPENVAMVNQRPILRSDFITQLESETGKRFAASSRAEQLKVLDEMVREELLVQRGLELDFAETDQSTRNALVSTISDQAIAEVTIGQATEQQLRDYFQQHAGKWATEGIMTLRDFVLPFGGARKDQGMEQARKAADELRAGAAAETIVARYGLTEARRQDQEYYFAVEYRLGDSLFAAVRDLSAGEISAPMAAKDGRMHIVQMVKNDKPVALSFAVARPQVLADFNDAAQTRIMDSTMKFLRSRAKILIGADYAGDYKP
ncbi:MAG: peptidylprolyl isomerase [Pseudomonadota bacterium]|nr:peptidylprolyl isomerase [Pseudomonadota bacterium]